METTIRSAIAAFVRDGVAEMAGAARRLTFVAASALLAAALAMAAIGCAVAALWIFAASQIGPCGAALAAAGALIVLCLAALGFAAIASRPPKPLRQAPPQAAPLTEAMLLFKEHKGAALLAALVAALLVGSDRTKR